MGQGAGLNHAVMSVGEVAPDRITLNSLLASLSPDLLHRKRRQEASGAGGGGEREEKVQGVVGGREGVVGRREGGKHGGGEGRAGRGVEEGGRLHGKF